MLLLKTLRPEFTPRMKCVVAVRKHTFYDAVTVFSDLPNADPHTSSLVSRFSNEASLTGGGRRLHLRPAVAMNPELQ